MFDVRLRRSYEETIYNYRPPWIHRWGNTYVFIFLLIVVGGSHFVRYPDVIAGEVEITTINPPVHLKAKVSGKIQKLLVKNNSQVVTNTPLVLLESSVSWEDFLEVKKNAQELLSYTLSEGNNEILGQMNFTGHLTLGALQTSYEDFIGSYYELADYYFYQFNQKEIVAKEQQLKDLNELTDILNQRKQIVDDQYEVGLNQLSMDSLDYEVSGVSKYSYYEKKYNLLNSKSNVLDVNKQVATSTSTISQLKFEIQSLRVKDEIEKKRLWINFKQKLQILYSRINEWEDDYVLCSPIKGVVNYASFWAENQNVNAGEIVVSVLPDSQAEVKARIRYPIQKSGKVKMGQKVHIKLDNFPYNEFGLLRGVIENKSTVPNTIVSGISGNVMMYSADVLLDKGLVTSYKDTLPVVQELYGSGEILTDDISLLMRFFSPLKAVFEEKIEK